jgi:sulfur carrier protein ThiS
LIAVPTVEITLNGLSLRVEAGTPVDVLLDVLREAAGLEPSLVAVDGRYLAPEAWSTVILREGSSVNTIE